jgi:rhodanese-related sulfurtransferase
MKEFLSIFFRACAIAIVCGAAGIGANQLASKPVPLIYVPPEVITISDTKVPLLSEKKAFEFFREPNTTFIDTRKQEDFAEAHVKGALHLSPDDVEDNFITVQPLLVDGNKLVLYCYGPECDMAEKVATFLISLGYKDITIMSSGFKAWEKAGLPVEKGRKAARS